MPIDKTYAKYLVDPGLLLQNVNRSATSLRADLRIYSSVQTTLTDSSFTTLLKARRFDSASWKILDGSMSGKLRTMRRYRVNDAIRLLYRTSRPRYEYFCQFLFPICRPNYSRVVLSAHFLSMISEKLFDYIVKSNILLCSDDELDKRYKDSILLFKELGANDDDYLPLIELNSLVGYYFSDTHEPDWHKECVSAVQDPEFMRGIVKNSDYTTTFEQEAELIYKEALPSTKRSYITSKDWVDDYYFPTTGSSFEHAKLSLQLNDEVDDIKIKLTKAQWNYILSRDTLYQKGLDTSPPVYAAIKKEEVGKVRLVSLADDTTYMTGLYIMEQLAYPYKHWYPIFVGGDLQSEIDLYTTLYSERTAGKFFLPYDSQGHDHQIENPELIAMSRILVKLAHSTGNYDTFIDQYATRVIGGELTYNIDGQSGHVAVRRGVLSGRIDTTYLDSMYELIKTRQAKRLISSQPGREAIRGDDYVGAFSTLLSAIEMRVALAYVGLVGRDNKFAITRNPEFLRKMVTPKRILAYPTRSMLAIYFGKPWTSESPTPFQWVLNANEALLTTARRLAIPWKTYITQRDTLLAGLPRKAKAYLALSPCDKGLGLILPPTTVDAPVQFPQLNILSTAQPWVYQHFSEICARSQVPTDSESLSAGVTNAFQSAFSSNYSKLNAQLMKTKRDVVANLSPRPVLGFTPGNLAYSTLFALHSTLSVAYRKRIQTISIVFPYNKVAHYPFSLKRKFLARYQLFLSFSTQRHKKDYEKFLLSGFSLQFSAGVVLNILLGQLHITDVCHPALSGCIARLAYADVKSRFKISNRLTTDHKLTPMTLTAHIQSAAVAISSIIFSSDWFRWLLSW